jgi:hypothetical protein
MYSPLKQHIAQACRILISSHTMHCHHPPSPHPCRNLVANCRKCTRNTPFPWACLDCISTPDRNINLPVTIVTKPAIGGITLGDAGKQNRYDRGGGTW